MKLENIGAELSRTTLSCPPYSSQHDAYSVGEFLRISGEALIHFIRNANEQIGEAAEGYINDESIDKIHAMYKDLGDNFFPMAHSNKPLRNLRIVETEKLQLIESFLYQFKQLAEHNLTLNTDFLEVVRNINNQ